MKTNKLGELLKAARFAIVGAVATLVHLGVAQGVLAAGIATVFWSNALGFGVAFLAGFLGHHYFTFTQTAPFWQAFRRYGVIAVAGFIVNNVVLFGLVQSGVLNEAVALAIAITIVPVGTFLASRFWGFKEGGEALQ
ncbi:MAG: GtrA family protein [Pseudomonadota bacterium]